MHQYKVPILYRVSFDFRAVHRISTHAQKEKLSTSWLQELLRELHMSKNILLCW